MPTATPDAVAPPRPRRRWLRRAVLAVLLLLVTVGGGAIYLLRTPPAHWQRYQQFKAAKTTDEIEQLAAQAEKQLHKLLAPSDFPASRPERLDEPSRDVAPADPASARMDEIHTVRLTRDELTALVAARHERWLESRGYVKPQAISDLMVDFDDRQLIALLQYDGRGFTQVFTGRFDLTFQDDGHATLHLDSFQAGQLPIPLNQIETYLSRRDDSSEAQRAGQWLSKLNSFRFKPVLDDLPHRRRARILGYAARKDAVDLTLRIQDHRTYAEMNRQLEGAGQTAGAIAIGE